MIDFHNHTIPNLDDGPKSKEDSLLMFQEAEKQGITEWRLSLSHAGGMAMASVIGIGGNL